MRTLDRLVLSVALVTNFMASTGENPSHGQLMMVGLLMLALISWVYLSRVDEEREDERKEQERNLINKIYKRG